MPVTLRATPRPLSYQRSSSNRRAPCTSKLQQCASWLPPCSPRLSGHPYQLSAILRLSVGPAQTLLHRLATSKASSGKGVDPCMFPPRLGPGPAGAFFQTRQNQGRCHSISNKPRFLVPSKVFTASNRRLRSTSHGWKSELTSRTNTRSSASR